MSRLGIREMPRGRDACAPHAQTVRTDHAYERAIRVVFAFQFHPVLYLTHHIMSALVSYASSDGEEDDDDVQPEKPAKVGRCHILLD